MRSIVASLFIERESRPELAGAQKRDRVSLTDLYNSLNSAEYIRHAR